MCTNQGTGTSSFAQMENLSSSLSQCIGTPLVQCEITSSWPRLAQARTPRGVFVGGQPLIGSLCEAWHPTLNNGFADGFRTQRRSDECAVCTVGLPEAHSDSRIGSRTRPPSLQVVPMGPKVSSRLWMFLPFHQKAPASQSKTSTTSPRSPNQGVTWARGTLLFVLSSLPPATWPVAVAVYSHWVHCRDQFEISRPALIGCSQHQGKVAQRGKRKSTRRPESCPAESCRADAVLNRVAHLRLGSAQRNFCLRQPTPALPPTGPSVAPSAHQGPFGTVAALDAGAPMLPLYINNALG